MWKQSNDLGDPINKSNGPGDGINNISKELSNCTINGKHPADIIIFSKDTSIDIIASKGAVEGVFPADVFNNANVDGNGDASCDGNGNGN